MSIRNHRPMFYLTTALAAALFLFPLFYFINNKYTWKGAQPMAGYLYLSTEDLARYPLRFLAREWAFYPDALLSPADFEHGAPENYVRHVSIGQYGGMELDDPDRSPHGSGTYALTLTLPDTPRAYSLELPVIYSAYRFYINGELAMQMGDPSPKQYEAVLQSKTITFSGSGNTQFLLAVTDRSGVYSGMTSPPAFGTPAAVGILRELRVFSTALAVGLGVIALLTATYFAARLRRKELWIFAALCACLLCHCMDTILYTYFPVPSGCYALRFLYLYAMYPLALLLHHRICSVKKKLAKAFLTATSIFYGCILLYGLLGSRLCYPLMDLFSLSIFLFKWVFAIYLLLTAALAIMQSRVSVGLQFSATVFFAASLVADRLMPLFEPVLGGWFIDAGRLALIVSMGASLGADLTDAYRFRRVFEQERRMMERQLAMQKEQFFQLTGKIERTRHACHDFRQHLRMIRSYAQKDNSAELIRYIDSISAPIADTKALTLCANPAADALLQHYYAMARQNQVDFQPRLDLPLELNFPAPDLCVILGNLLENAVEACLRQTAGPRFIRFKGTGEQNRLVLMLENSYDGHCLMERQCFLSNKHEGVGIGTESVREVVNRHDGLIRFLPGESVFRVQVLIPLSSSSAYRRQ